MDLEHINKYHYLVADLLNEIMNLFFLIQSPQLVIVSMGDQEIVTDLDYVLSFSFTKVFHFL